jgi:outer membrane protein assembly factor BamD
MDYEPCWWFRFGLSLSHHRMSYTWDEVRYLSNDYMNGEIRYADNTLLATTGGQYHTPDKELWMRQPSYAVLDLPIQFTFGPSHRHRFSLINSIRKYYNQWFTDYADGLDANMLKDGDYYSAAEMLDTFRRTFSRSVFIEDAEAMYAICLYNMCPSPERDQSTTSQAIIAISEYMAHYPESEQLILFKDMTADLTWRLHEKAFVNAYTYYKIGRYNAAIIAFRNALKMYSDTHRREDLLYYITMASFKLAENSVEEKRLDRYMSTLDAYYSFVMEYPESKYSKEMEQVAEVTKRYIEKNKQEE